MLTYISQVVGDSLALASRLIPRTSFSTNASRSTLVSALTAANNLAPGLIILIGPPSSFPGDGTTSVTDAWRSSIFHITVVAGWNWNATKAEKIGQYDLVGKAIDNLRKITPDAAYVVSKILFEFQAEGADTLFPVQNEADVHEPNHEGKLPLDRAILSMLMELFPCQCLSGASIIHSSCKLKRNSTCGPDIAALAA
jgi:hypothetical protein